jgi:hypothetical protein
MALKSIYVIFRISKEGILFKDITPLLIDPGRNECLKILVDSLKGNRQSHRVESRGFSSGC